MCIRDRLSIQQNPILEMCDVLSICFYLSAGGPAEINNNGMACSNVQELTSACIVLSDNDFDLPNISVYPNPNNGIIRVKGITEGQYQISDLTGRIIKMGYVENNIIEFMEKEAGVYFLTFILPKDSFTISIIKEWSV